MGSNDSAGEAGCQQSGVEATEVSPAGWGRGGIRPADARLLRYGPGPEVALAILDDHPQGHADWNTAKAKGPNSRRDRS
jgi:hypothetical protein